MDLPKMSEIYHAVLEIGSQQRQWQPESDQVRLVTPQSMTLRMTHLSLLCDVSNHFLAMLHFEGGHGIRHNYQYSCPLSSHFIPAFCAFCRTQGMWIRGLSSIHPMAMNRQSEGYSIKKVSGRCFCSLLFGPPTLRISIYSDHPHAELQNFLDHPTPEYVLVGHGQTPPPLTFLMEYL